MIDVQAAMLRAYLQGDAEAARDVFEEFIVADPEAAENLAPLIQMAFAIAARTRFTPAWSEADLAQYVATIRAKSSDQADLLDPLAAKSELRTALGESVPAWPDEEARAMADIILLASLVESLELDAAGIDALLRQARELSQPTH
jgi:hypothetical protein